MEYSSRGNVHKYVRRPFAGAALLFLLGELILVSGLLRDAQAQTKPPAAPNPYTTWRDYGGGEDASQYLRARADQPFQRQKAAGCVDLSNRRRFQVSLQPGCRRRCDVCSRKEQLDRRARCRHGQGNLDPRKPPRPHHYARHQLLGKQRPVGPAPAVLEQQLPAGDRRQHRPVHYVVRHETARSIFGQAWAAIPPRSPPIRDARAHLRKPHHSRLGDQPGV